MLIYIFFSIIYNISMETAAVLPEESGQNILLQIRQIRRRITLVVFAVMGMFLFTSQFFVYFNSSLFDSRNATVTERLSNVFDKSVVGLFVFMSLLLIAMINLSLRPLFRYLKNRSDYEKARTAALRIPWIIIYSQMVFWLVGVTVFFILRNWELSSGYSYALVYMQKISVGLMSSIFTSQIINLILIKPRLLLNIQSIRSGENDRFTRWRDIFIIITLIITFITYFGSLSYYFYTSAPGRVTLAMFRFSFVSTSAFLSLFGIVMTILSRSEFRRQVSILHGRMADLVSGGADLSRRVNMITFDEVGEIAHLINDFLTHLDRDFRSLRDLILEVGQDSDHISESSGSLALRSREQNQRLDEISSTMEKFSAIMDKVHQNVGRETEIIQMNASAAEELNRGIEAISNQSAMVKSKTSQNREAAHKSISIVTSSVESTLRMSEKMKDIASMIKTVGDQSEQIDDIIGTIQTIAENTDMLSMNAAIEAAHAGAAGTGFAIVAQEIRELAELSSRSAQGISQLIHNIKQSIIDAVAMSTMGEVEAQEGQKMAEEAGKALSAIVSNIEETDGMIGEITSVTQEQKNLSEHFLEGVESLSQFSTQIQSAIDEQTAEAAQIDRNLQEISRFNEDNSQAAEKLARLSDDLKTLGERLKIIVMQFQITSEQGEQPPREVIFESLGQQELQDLSAQQMPAMPAESIPEIPLEPEPQE